MSASQPFPRADPSPGAQVVTPVPEGGHRGEAQAELVEVHSALARAVSQRYHDHGVDPSLLHQAAQAALVEAAAAFDPDAGGDFVTFALPRVRAAVKTCFRGAGGRIGEPPPRDRAPIVHHQGVPRSS